MFPCSLKVNGYGPLFPKTPRRPSALSDNNSICASFLGQKVIPQDGNFILCVLSCNFTRRNVQICHVCRCSRNVVMVISTEYHLLLTSLNRVILSNVLQIV